MGNLLLLISIDKHCNFVRCSVNCFGLGGFGDLDSWMERTFIAVAFDHKKNREGVFPSLAAIRRNCLCLFVCFFLGRRAGRFYAFRVHRWAFCGDIVYHSSPFKRTRVSSQLSDDDCPFFAENSKNKNEKLFFPLTNEHLLMRWVQKGNPKSPHAKGCQQK